MNFCFLYFIFDFYLHFPDVPVHRDLVPILYSRYSATGTPLFFFFFVVPKNSHAFSYN